MDFYQLCTKEIEGGHKKGQLELYPDFKVGRSKDLMVRGRSFYAIWDEEKGLWSTDEYDVQRLVDNDLSRFADKQKAETGVSYNVKYLRSSNSGIWYQFKKFLQNLSDNSHQLDENLTFANTEVKKNDFVSRRLGYSLSPGSVSAWDELVGTLYSVEERAKIEWVIGAIVSGDAKKIQKFLVLYGSAGTGKSTILNIVQKLFDGYTASFEAKALAGRGNDFSTEVFRNNPLVAIQHDGDLSKIEDNSKLNSIISHEEMTMNEKYKASYTAKVNAFLLMATNQPVRISDAKSGIIRRLIDAHPTGVRIPANHYTALMTQVDFELGAIAWHCLQVYREMGKNYYNGYRPLEMMLQTDIFFNFIEANFDIFKDQDSTSLKQAYILYKEYCNDTGIERVQPMYKVREELRNYFDEFHEREQIDGHTVRSYYKGFVASKFKTESKKDNTFSLVIEESESLFDEHYANQPAQYGTKNEIPKKAWGEISTKLSDLDTSKLHFVKVPENHIVIDFDLKGEDGGRSLERNLEAASAWPATYAELSKSGAGVHLHYNYTGGEAAGLRNDFSEGIEVKTFPGDASLRRLLTRCNSVPIADLAGGLPLKEKKMLPATTIQSEKGLRELIARNLRKEIHPGTKPSIDFIHKILEEAYADGLSYDVTDLQPRILAFANNSTNQAMTCIKTVQKMRFQGEEAEPPAQTEIADERLVIFDVEVYPNLFVICWKYEGDDYVTRMINPRAQDVEGLLRFKLVGFNNRRYDNHIIYAAIMGYNNKQLFQLSQKLISNDRNAAFGEAYNLSYADIWDFSSLKQTLKKFQIMLGLPHVELNLPWDEDVPDDMVEVVVEYCVNDVHTTDATLQARRQDLVAREILAELSGLTVNDTTQKHTARIIFGADKDAYKDFVYTDLRKEFPGYTFDMGKSQYRGENPGEGGYVYAEPGMYENVAVLDVTSMHPTSIKELDFFGPYTPNYTKLVEARIAIKQGDYNEAMRIMPKLEPFLTRPHEGYDKEGGEALAYALKIVVNIVYGLTSAKFDNPFRNKENIDNIVAKRGALFMIDLKYFVQERGFKVVHIKTDSIKIPDATPEIVRDVEIFGEKYGYTFEHEATYEKMALVNDAVYVAKTGGTWKAVGAQFQHPYVYKSLFSGENIEFNDLCETKQVMGGAIYMDFEHDRPIVLVEGMHFVGRIGRFVPVEEGCGGAMLYRVKDGKHYAVTGTKGYLWKEAHMTSIDEVDISYFERLLDEAKKSIAKHGDFERFVS
jgi:hypothetical protein